MGRPAPKKRAPKKAKPVEVRVVRPKGRVVAPAESKLDILPKGQPTAEDRRDAMLLYVMDLEKRPVSWLHKTHFPHLFFSTVQQWWNRDKWEEKRRDFWHRVDQALVRDFQQRVVRARMTELENLEGFATKLHGHIARSETVTMEIDGKSVTLPMVPPTYTKRESAVKLMIAIDERIDAKRNAILGDLPVVGASNMGPAAMNPNISPDEARAMAKARLEVMRKQLPEAVALGEVEDPVDAEGAEAP